MKTKLHVSYCTKEYLNGFEFTTYEINSEGYLKLGVIEIDNPFSIPSKADVNYEHIVHMKNEIKSHKAQINVLENSIKDLLCIESKGK